ncbi:family 16 glycoside hydrolase [Pontibacter liquoris]|uniref:family 16 glycoside hydrolase n=1 Tax=Pontibacter liquoris TaxID=2905677 RepID=UPI001FA6AD2C|nr:family 16 glycoside hydrolase [Pontibacter liquoris]
MTFFKNPGKTWHIAGDVSADMKKQNVLHTSDGAGILVNMPTKRSHGTDLYTGVEHGDMDLELDYLMAKGANSGIYLQGRYELQLEDSWPQTLPTAASNGGVYQRWDDSKPKGQQGYEGYAPRQNVSRAPGLWQHLKISFQAPRFDASGKKTENAKLLRVELNGVLIHENVELSGPTRGAMANDEKPTGPLRFQGDHGAVAFRNISITDYSKPRPELANLTYTVYKGKFEKEPDFNALPPEAKGTSVVMTGGLKELPKDFLIRYTGTLQVPQAGEYTFNLNASGGRGQMKLNNKVVIPMGSREPRAKVTLPAGNVPFELLYTKVVEWDQPAVGLAVAGPGIREYILGDATVNSNRNDAPAGPILVDAPVNTILRSFMDLPSEEVNGRGTRVVHAVNVGNPAKVNYTYDPDNGNVVQVWRGDFLDATPMWYSRGNGSSRPVGAVQYFGKPAFAVAKLSSPQAAWATDTVGTGFRPKGYVLDANDQPTFRYTVYGTTVEDQIRVLENGQGIRRELTVQNPSGTLYARLAAGTAIEPISKDTYLVDGKAYYLRVDDAGGAKPFVRDSEGRKELLLPIQGKVSYSILF